MQPYIQHKHTLPCECMPMPMPMFISPHDLPPCLHETFFRGGGDLSFSLSYPTLSYCPMSCHHLSSMSTTCHNFFIMPTFCTCSVMPFQICRLSLFSSLHIDHLAPFTMKRLRGWKLKLRRGYLMISGLASLYACLLLYNELELFAHFHLDYDH